MDDVQLGCIVRSKAGRDKGRLFVVIGLTDGFALLSDGRMRRIAKPKRKKFKHLETVTFFENRVGDKLRSVEKVHNSELRHMLNEFMALHEEPSQPLEA